MINHIRTFVGMSVFHHFIVVVIVVAGVVAGLETSPATMARYGALLHVLDKLILGIFVVEALLTWRHCRTASCKLHAPHPI